MSAPRTVMACLDLARAHLAQAGVEQPRLDAEALLAHVLDMERIQLYVQHDRPMNAAELDAYRAAIARRARKEPVAYITGRREFYSREFAVDRRVLIPRPETERLVEAALEELKKRFGSERSARLVDVGTGSGAVAVTLALERPNAAVVACDVSADALQVAEENAKSWDVVDRISFCRSDLLNDVPAGPYHAIVSNPPYIADGDWPDLPVDVRDYEPRTALLGGGDGLALIRRLLAQAGERLADGGFVALEIGADQARAVLDIGASCGFREKTVLQDLAGRDRVAVMAKESA